MDDRDAAGVGTAVLFSLMVAVPSLDPEGGDVRIESVMKLLLVRRFANMATEQLIIERQRLVTPRMDGTIGWLVR